MLKFYYYLIAPVCFIIYTLMYIRIAHYYKIYDHPVGRSSHQNRTITGFGVFVLFGLLLYSLPFHHTLNSFFIIGLIMVSTISYIDDLVFVKHFIRLIFQIFALTLMALALPFDYMMDFEKWPLIIAIVILGIGVLNAFNFMDGINGMLGLNSLVILLSFLWLNSHSIDVKGNEVTFIKNEFLYTNIIGVSIFLGLNLRRKAIVFAGDTGSIALAFIILYLMLNLIFKTGNYAYLLLFAVFGVDAGLTVIFKLLLRENIFVPHRDFLFKKLVHVGKYKHVNISIIYAGLQALVNTIIIALPLQGRLSAQLSILFIFTITLCSVYIFIRNKYTKKRVIRLKEVDDSEQ